MALDWSKEISFSGLRKRTPRTKKVEYPSKTYINLVVKEKKQFDARSTVPKIVLLVLVTIAVCKFGIFDFYDKVNQKEAELSAQTQVLQGLQSRLTDYEAVRAEYETYETSKLAANDTTVSVIDALALVDRVVAPAARVDSIEVKGNTLSLELSNVTLDGVGKLVNKLYEQPTVANVSVSTATTDKAQANVMTTATMSITLKVAV